MLSCKEVSKLVSQSLDAELPFRKRVGVRIHLMMCRACARFLKQLRFLRQASRLFEEKFNDPELQPPLPAETKKRIQEALLKNR